MKLVIFVDDFFYLVLCGCVFSLIGFMFTRSTFLGNLVGIFTYMLMIMLPSFIIKIFTDQYLHPEDSAALFIVIYVALVTLFYKKYLSNRD